MSTPPRPRQLWSESFPRPCPLGCGVPLGVCLGPALIHGSRGLRSDSFFSHVILSLLISLLMQHFDNTKSTDSLPQYPQVGCWLRPFSRPLSFGCCSNAVKVQQSMTCKRRDQSGLFFLVSVRSAGVPDKKKNLKMSRTLDLSNTAQQFFLY